MCLCTHPTATQSLTMKATMQAPTTQPLKKNQHQACLPTMIERRVRTSAKQTMSCQAGHTKFRMPNWRTPCYWRFCDVELKRCRVEMETSLLYLVCTVPIPALLVRQPVGARNLLFCTLLDVEAQSAVLLSQLLLQCKIALGSLVVALMCPASGGCLTPSIGCGQVCMARSRMMSVVASVSRVIADMVLMLMLCQIHWQLWRTNPPTLGTVLSVRYPPGRCLPTCSHPVGCAFE